jgi:hypothetical protein
VTDDDDVVESGAIDVDYHRIHPVVDTGGGQVAGLAPAPRQVDREHCQLRIQTVKLGDRGIPAVTGMLGAMHKH